MLKISLNEIRGQIQIHPENWINKDGTNCYAYALGLDVNEEEICEYAYQPGTFSKISKPASEEEYYTYDNLIMRLESDFKVLGIDYKEIEPDYEIDSDEWKIALMIFEDGIYDDLLCDFHFLRTNKNGKWIHKEGYHGMPSIKDCSNQIITDPRECDLIFYEYKKCYALRLNKG